MSEIYNHVLYHKSIEGETISKEKYKNLLREKFENTDYWNGNFAWEDYRIELPRDIELAKVST